MEIHPIVNYIFSSIGLLASILTIKNSIRWISTEEKYSYKLSPLKYIILLIISKGAYKNKEKSERYLKYLYLSKLYSKTAYKQNTAIKEIVGLGDIQWAFTVLVERAGRKPELSPENKSYLIESIKNLCKKM